VTTLVDTHTHAFPDATQGRAWLESLGIEHPRRSGFHEELDGLARQAEIDRSVILLYYHRAADRFDELVDDGVPEGEAREAVRDEIRAYNAWGLAVGRANPRLVPFIGVNARLMSPEEIRAEILDAGANGAKGVKITPGSMRAYADNSLLEPIFEACVEARLPLLSQSGRGSGAGPSPGSDPWGHPRYWFDPLARHPELTLILAHMAHGFEDTLGELLEARPNAYTDTSMRLSGLGKPDRPTAEDLVATIRRLGVERVLFGTNYPFVSPVVYAEVFESLPLGLEERAAIACGNYERIVGG
jgi:predicted TIM-barrel fold metal-dependent hydrolase